MELNYSFGEYQNYFVYYAYSNKGVVATTTPIPDKQQAFDNLKKSIEQITKDHVHLIFGERDLILEDILFSVLKEPKHNPGEIQIDYSFLTDKKKLVMETLKNSTPGSVISYRSLAIESGLTKNHARFVGNVMSSNPLPILVPCHRVVKENGMLGNYSAYGGTSSKKRYLEFEQNHLQS